MGVIVRPDDLASIMAEVYARLDAIERTSGPMHDFAIRDANGILRVAGGNLPALGISPAQEGIRVVDAYGNPIFDTLGLTSVMQSLGSCSPNGTNSNTIAGEFPSSGHVSISVPRPVAIQVLCAFSAWASAAGSMNCGLNVDGAGNGFNCGPIQNAAYSATTSMPIMLFGYAYLAAGTHTVGLFSQWVTGAAPQVPNAAYSLLDVRQLGS